MRKLIAVLALALTPMLLFAQSGITGGNTQTQRFTGAPSGSCGPSQLAINNATGDFYICKAGAWLKVGVSSGAGSPAGATGSLQFNGGSGAFEAVTPGTIVTGNTNCDGFMAPCQLYSVLDESTFTYFLAGKDSNGPVGNYIDLYQYAGGLFLDASPDGVDTAGLGLNATDDGNIYFQGYRSSKITGIKLYPSSQIVGVGRLQFSSGQYQTGVGDSNLAAGAGWGNTAVAQATGSDNNPRFTIVAGGSGIAASPTFTFTYANGDMSSGANLVNYVCAQSGGDDLTNTHTVVTTTRNQASQVFTWLGTPVTGKVYEITCFGAATN